MNNSVFKYCPVCSSEMLDKSIEGRKRQVCSSCGWIHYENPLPCSAAFVQNERGEILLVQRGVEPGIGKWGLPSGFIEIDETPQQGCLRELKEETGLEGNISELIGVYSQESSLYKRVIIIGFRMEVRGNLKPGSDSLDAGYFPPDSLPEIAFRSHREMIKDGQR